MALWDPCKNYREQHDAHADGENGRHVFGVKLRLVQGAVSGVQA